MSRAERLEFQRAGVTVIEQEKLDPRNSPGLLAELSALLLVSAKITAEIISRLDQCRVIARYGTGTDNVAVEEATRRGILVTNVPDFCIPEMADHTMALILGIARKLLIMDRCTRTGEWHARVRRPVHRLAGKTLGLMGFGRIAQAVARRAYAFDLQLKAYSPHLDRSAAENLHVEPVTLEDLLATSDFVSLHVPLTSETHHMIGERQLQLMKPEAILINTARGAVIDEKALVRALSEGWIAGAGLDVYEGLAMFDSPPQHTDHPLFHLENVILTPHSGGCSVESLEFSHREAARQAISVLQGEWPSNCVNPSVIPRFPLRRAAGSA